MATRCSILAWRIPCKEEPGGLQSIESQKVGHTEATEHACIYSDYKKVYIDIDTYIVRQNHVTVSKQLI